MMSDRDVEAINALVNILQGFAPPPACGKKSAVGQKMGAKSSKLAMFSLKFSTECLNILQISLNQNAEAMDIHEEIVESNQASYELC